MKIAYIRTTLHKGSGLANHIFEISKQIRQSRNFTALLCRETNVKMVDIYIRELTFFGSGIPFTRNIIFPFRCIRTLRQFDIIHSQYHPSIFVGNIAKRLLNKPHVFTFHGFAPIRVWRNVSQRLKMMDHRLGTFLALRLGVDKIITVSNYLKNVLIKNYFVKRNKINVVYNGVDTAKFNIGDNGKSIRYRYKLRDNPVVLYLGRLAPYKGVQYLIQAIPLVLKVFPDVKFVVGGASRFDSPAIGELIRRLNVERAIRFLGYIPDEEIPKIYACCDVFCYPSLWEGFGLTPAEAQASGKPVVAFDNCAIPEVVKNGETGILLPPKNIQDLAAAIIRLLDDKALRDEMGINGRKRVSKLFSWEKAGKQTLQIYRSIM
ncbi:MAG: glycosyltransferase family 4 protein [Candidatus Ranarchaeia archaeon]